MLMKFKYEKEFREAHPETIGEKDSTFDLCNYTEWLETKVSRVELPVILQITKIIDGLADEYSNEQKLAYMGNDQKIIRENDIKINTLMELKRVIDKSNLSK